MSKTTYLKCNCIFKKITKKYNLKNYFSFYYIMKKMLLRNETLEKLTNNFIGVFTNN